MSHILYIYTRIEAFYTRREIKILDRSKNYYITKLAQNKFNERL